MSNIIFTTSLVLIKMLKNILTKCKDGKAVNINFPIPLQHQKAIVKVCFHAEGFIHDLSYNFISLDPH